MPSARWRHVNLSDGDLAFLAWVLKGREEVTLAKLGLRRDEKTRTLFRKLEPSNCGENKAQTAVWGLHGSHRQDDQAYKAQASGAPISLVTIRRTLDPRDTCNC